MEQKTYKNVLKSFKTSIKNRLEQDTAGEGMDLLRNVVAINNANSRFCKFVFYIDKRIIA